VAALEIMIATPAVRNLIREAKTYQLPSMIQTGKKYGMQLLDDAIMELLNRGVIGADEGISRRTTRPGSGLSSSRSRRTSRKSDGREGRCSENRTWITSWITCSGSATGSPT
jgi:hypothetical protein